MKAYQLGWDRKGGRSGTLKRKRINVKVLRGMNSSPMEKQKTTLGEQSEAAACSKNNSACSFAQVSFSFYFFFSFPFLLCFLLINNKMHVGLFTGWGFWVGFFFCYCKTAEIWQEQRRSKNKRLKMLKYIQQRGADPKLQVTSSCRCHLKVQMDQQFK